MVVITDVLQAAPSQRDNRQGNTLCPIEVNIALISCLLSSKKNKHKESSVACTETKHAEHVHDLTQWGTISMTKHRCHDKQERWWGDRTVPKESRSTATLLLNQDRLACRVDKDLIPRPLEIVEGGGGCGKLELCRSRCPEHKI